jgi:hypothetical protein
VVIDIEPIRERFSAVAPFLDERGRRLVAAAKAFAAGYGGITAVAMATGCPSRPAPASGTKSSTASSPSSGQNWRAKPLVSYRVIVELISTTTTKPSLLCAVNSTPANTPAAVVSDVDMAAINLKRAEFHGEWNYTISANDHPPNRALIL